MTGSIRSMGRMSQLQRLRRRDPWESGAMRSVASGRTLPTTVARTIESSTLYDQMQPTNSDMAASGPTLPGRRSKSAAI